MRHFLLRASIVASLVALAATAQADPRSGAVARESLIPSTVVTANAGVDRAHAWMTDALLGAFRGEVSLAQVAAHSAERQLSAKPHQNPAFPAAFVFQSNSAMFLAVSTNGRTGRGTRCGG